MACCGHKGGGQNAPRQSNAGQTSYSGAAARPSQTNAGATPRYSSASKIGKPASRKRIELHVFHDNDEGEGEWRDGEMEGYQDSNLMNFPETPTRQPYYQEDNGEDFGISACKCGDNSEGEEDYEEEEVVVVPFRIQLKNEKRGQGRDQNSPILTFNPTQNGVAVNVKTFPGFDSEEEGLDEECAEVSACGKPTCRGPSGRSVM